MVPMPYTVVTHDPIAKVATIEEARALARRACELYLAASKVGLNDWGRFLEQCDNIGEEGGTVGPLPDGRIIEVRRTP